MKASKQLCLFLSYFKSFTLLKKSKANNDISLKSKKCIRLFELFFKLCRTA